MWVGAICYPHIYPHDKSGFYRIIAEWCGLYLAEKPIQQGVVRIVADAYGILYGGHRFRQRNIQNHSRICAVKHKLSTWTTYALFSDRTHYALLENSGRQLGFFSKAKH
jgi:hypothetical protein